MQPALKNVSIGLDELLVEGKLRRRVSCVERMDFNKGAGMHECIVLYCT